MHQLSKTDFLQYLACPEELWLSKNTEEISNPPSLDMLHRMEQGRLIDDLGKDYFLQQFSTDLKGKGWDILYQSTATADGFLARADIIALNRDSNMVKIYEVKGSTKIKEEHIKDVAFQKMVFELEGYKVERCHLIYVDNGYVLNGDLNIENLFIVEEITEQVNETYADVQMKAIEALAFINGSEPEKRITLGCCNKLKCSFVQRHFHDLPDYTVYDISRIHINKLQTLVSNDILDIMDVPSDFPLSKKQRLQVDIAQNDEIRINREAISGELNKLEYPLYFLDYETFSYVVPVQNGHRPYQQMLFQYSLHVVEYPGAKVEHFEYLLNQKEEPVSNLLASLQENIDTDNGTVLVWNKRFEKDRNKECAEIYPEYSEFLLALNDRVYDLMDVFTKGYYSHPGFKGKTSLKNVLPVLCPELSYKILHVQNGLEANIKWHHWTDGQYRGEENEFIKRALLKYCQLDTWAMVRIWEELGRTVLEESMAVV
ncbi:DUF2779 domain-containing protein [Saprospiraceae bacterium]|jgi:CRISPR/Cas system-associated exonuclease Cas4 (RecB family)|nr:DUF2779 domain-containing protein [Saprospiraceae bacterium]